jgi:hypothetical protein
MFTQSPSNHLENSRQQKISNNYKKEVLTLKWSAAVVFPLSEMDLLGDKPSSDPSCTGDGGRGGAT